MSLFDGPVRGFAEKLVASFEATSQLYIEQSKLIDPIKPELAWQKLRATMLAEMLIEVSKHIREVAGI